jgi:EAL domain-containing protein (putative c-di-GMP-specific phosphodiesterase class I)
MIRDLLIPRNCRHEHASQIAVSRRIPLRRYAMSSLAQDVGFPATSRMKSREVGRPWRMFESTRFASWSAGERARQLGSGLVAASGADGMQLDKFPDTKDRSISGDPVLLELRDALARREFALAFQPKVDLRTREYTGAEVLVRWHNRTIGNVSPSQFIPVAERHGLISGIGAWVLGKVIEQMVDLPSCVRRRSLAINVSAIQLRDPCFVPWLMALLEEAQVCGTRIEIELTESVFAEDPHATGRRLAELRNKGITITLDDFGTGYSALSHLRHFPVDVIKISPDFVSDLTADRASGRLVGAVIALAKSLDLKVVAEGIENDDQAERLVELGCDIGQGYLFARPMGFGAFVDWVSTRHR